MVTLTTAIAEKVFLDVITDANWGQAPVRERALEILKRIDVRLAREPRDLEEVTLYKHVWNGEEQILIIEPVRDIIFELVPDQSYRLPNRAKIAYRMGRYIPGELTFLMEGLGSRGKAFKRNGHLENFRKMRTTFHGVEGDYYIKYTPWSRKKDSKVGQIDVFRFEKDGIYSWSIGTSGKTVDQALA